jgi:hypothetical protein
VSVELMMRAIPEDCELMRLALADAPGVRDMIPGFLYEASFSSWRRHEALRRHRHAFPELMALQLYAGKWKSRSVESVLLQMAPAPVTAQDRELAALVESGRSLFDDDSAGLVSAVQVREVARFLGFLDPEVNAGERWPVLEEILDFYRRVAAVPGLAVIVAYQ